MTGNFFADNADLQHRFDDLKLEEAIEILENGYTNHQQYPAAPRNYADAMDSYRRILTVLGDICANQIAPRAAEADEEGAQFEDGQVTFPAATLNGLELLRQADMMGALLPWEHGGLNLPGSILQMMIEIISRADLGLVAIFGLEEISATIAEYGDADLQARILPRFARGEVTGAMVLTEPDSGSDLGIVQTRATYDEEAAVWRLNGVKRFITNGNADILLVLARSEENSTDARGLSMFVVEADETVRIRRIEDKMGFHAAPTCELEFRNTPARLLGKRRFGLIRYAMAMMNAARIGVAAQAIGIAEAAYREAYSYALKRIQFGRSIDNIPAVYRMLLSMRGDIETTRALVYEAGRWVDLKRAYELLKERGEFGARERRQLKQADRLAGILTPLAKYHATEMGNRVCYQAIQVHGGTGYMREFSVERHYRDIRVTSIYEGTSQLQIVAATGGLLGYSLDTLFDEWAAQDYGPEQAALAKQVKEATALLNRSIDHLKEQDDRALIDYYAQDLADMAIQVLTSWLALQDGRATKRKRELAQIYITERLSDFRGKMTKIQALDPTPVSAREGILSETL
jgi:hypothetical protein